MNFLHQLIFIIVGLSWWKLIGLY
ncbi:MAG: hypothetical protein KBE02_04105 [Sulfurospirillum sp.]|nr:hypothetical protein [Sulfurospirillum sp.]